MNYETYYSDGGHCGPFANIDKAKEHAKRYLQGRSMHCAQNASVEIRPSDSKVVGGYQENATSFYVRGFRSREQAERLEKFGAAVLSILANVYDDTLEEIENAAIDSGLVPFNAFNEINKLR